MKKVYAIEDRCLGCHLCEVACRTAHSLTGDVVKAHLWENPRPLSRVHVEGTSKASVAVNCRHCKDAPCVDGCIAAAMRKDPISGIVFCDKDKCVACRTCMVMCPYDAVKVESYALKCDLCSTGWAQGDPACVHGCINQALVFVDLDEAKATAKELS